MPRELMVSPKGDCLWAKVFKASSFEDDSPKSWSIRLLLDPNDPATIEFIEKLEAVFVAEHGPKAKVARYGWPFAEQETKDDKGRAVKTGLLEFRFKRNELWPNGDPQTPPIVVDSKKNRWPEDKLIGNGSKVRIAFVCATWDVNGKGMTLILEQVQVLDLVEYAAPDTDLFDVEEGYVVDTEQGNSPFEDAPEPVGIAAQIRARAAQVEAEKDQLPDEDVPF